MKHTIASVTKQVRKLAGALPVTRQSCRILAAKIYGHDAQQENVIGNITQHFTRVQINDWFDNVVLPLPEYQEEHRHGSQRWQWPEGDNIHWLYTAIYYVLMWQKRAALMPLTLAFATQIKEQEEG